MYDGERWSMVTCAADFRKCWDQGYRGRTTTDDDNSFITVVEFLRPVLGMDKLSLEIRAAREGRRVSALVIIVAAAQVKESTGVAGWLFVFADFRLNGPERIR